MATVTVSDASLTAIADAIREKLDVETTYLPSQMAAAIESISVADLTSADEDKVVVESSGEYVLQAQTSRTITQNGTYDTTTNNQVVVSISGGGGTSIVNPSYFMEETGLICTLNGRTFTKTSNDPAFVAYFYLTAGYTSPILVSETQDGAAYTTNYDGGTPILPEDTIEHGGKTYYVSPLTRGMPSDLYSTNGFALKIGSYEDSLSAAEGLLDIAIITANLIDKTITRNGTYVASDDDVDGYSRVTVTVSGGGSTNILSGTKIPTASDGSDGDIYILYGQDGVRNSDGQYISTGYSGDSSSKYVIDFMLAASQVGQYPTPFGGRSQGGSVTDASNVHIMNTSTMIGWGSSQNTAFNVGYSSMIGKLSHIELEAGTALMRVGDDEYSYTFSPTSINATTSVGIFALIANNSVVTACMANDMVLYSFEIYENDTLVHRFVPAIDDNDTVCVYDEVANEYKYHSGGGTLTYVNGGTIIDTYLKVNGAWAPIEGQNVDNVNTEGGSDTEQKPRYVYVFDNPRNATMNLYGTNDIIYPAQVQTQQYGYVFLFADNQTTNITIDGVTHSSSDIQIGSYWNDDNVYAFADESQGFSIALNAGDSGNHACTIIAVEGTFATKYTQTMFKVASASQTISAALGEAYVLLLFCIYGGGSTASITLMGESVTINRRANRYSNSIYCYATKLTNLAANDVVSVSIDATAANVIGIMGIFGDANA